MNFGDGMHRSHQRLECFFKRHFSEDICDILRLAEPCVVVGQNYDHAFKFVVLTDDTLYILANPPQLESDIELCVALQFINDIHQVHDIPDFLSGELKNNVQHLAFTYSTTDQPTSSISRSSSKRTSQRQDAKINVLSTGPGISLKKNDMTMLDNQNLKRKTILKSSSSSSDEPDSTGRMSSIRFEMDQPTTSGRPRTFSDPFSSLPGVTRTAMSVPMHLSVIQHDTSKVENTKQTTESKTKRNVHSPRPLPPPAPGTENFHALTVLNSPKAKRGTRRRKIQSERRADTSNDSALLKASLAHSASDSQLTKHSYPQDYKREKDLRVQSQRGPQQLFVNQNITDNSRGKKEKQNLIENLTTPKISVSSAGDVQGTSNLSSSSLNQSISARIGSFFSKNNGRRSPNTSLSTSNNNMSKRIQLGHGNLLDVQYGTDDVSKNIEEMKMDIYLLNADSHFIPLLRLTRMNAILRQTQEMETSNDKGGIPFNSRVLEEFYQLRTDLLACDRIEQAFILTKELLTGSQKSIHLKNLFWNNAELIHYYVNTLNAYLIEPERIVISGDKADELDYMLVIADLIINMLFNTETCPSRNKILFGQRGDLLYKMVRISLTKPDLLRRSEKQPLSHAAAMLLAGVERQETESEKEYELIDLLGEWTDASSCLLYELFKATEQSKWAYQDARRLSILSIIRLMENHSDILRYLNDLIERMMQRLLKSENILRPSTVVLVFKQFSLLQYIFDNSTMLSRYVTDHYYEEFRYYIDSPAVIDRIPESPISPFLLDLLSDVINAVVQKY